MLLFLLLQLLFGAAPSAGLVDGSFESLLTANADLGWGGVPAASNYGYVCTGQAERVAFPGGWSFWGWSGGINGPSGFGAAFAQDGSAHIFMQAGYVAPEIESQVRCGCRTLPSRIFVAARLWCC